MSKSAFKAKQYLSVGIPTIASDIGENNKFVLHNQNGFLCKNGSDFENAINKIIDMSDEEYFEFSRSAINHRENFSIKKYCEMLVEIHKNAI